MSVRNGLLALLAESPKYGFQLKKEFEDATGALWPLNVGQVYTTLNRLVRDGQVVTDSGHGADPATNVGDEGQKRYRITDAGRDELRDWFGSARPRLAPERDEVVIKIAMSLRDRTIDTLGIIADQRRSTTETLQRFTRARSRGEPDDLGRRIALDAIVASISAELHWLDQAEEFLTASTESHHAAGARPAQPPTRRRNR